MIIKKIVSFAFIFAFVITFSGYITPKVQAAQTFPTGCSSAIGYSITNGNPCNGTSNATERLAGCPSVIGYSTSNGNACSGTSEAILSIEGCNSMFGYSLTNGNPCNGKLIAEFYYAPIITPYLPTTGVAPISLTNIAFLSMLGLLAIGGVVYATRKAKSV